MGIAGGILFGVEMVFIHGVDPLDILEARALFLQREPTSLSRVAAVIGAGGYFSLVAAVTAWEHIGWGYRVLWLVAPLILSGFSIFSGGRQTIFQILLLLLFSLPLRRLAGASRIATKRMILVSIAFVMLGVAYGMTAGYERNDRLDDLSKKDLLMALFDAQVNPELDEILEDMPPRVRDGIAELLFYFSHEIPSFLVFWDSERPGPYGGLWQFPFIARRLENVGLLSISVDDRMNSVYDLYAASGRFAQVWQTWFRDLIIDFGTTGALIVSALLGFGAGRVQRRMMKNPSLSSGFLYTGVLLCCAYSILLAAVSDTLVMFYMAGAIVLYLRSGRSGIGRSPCSVHVAEQATASARST
jgi:hypothetical protein